MHNWIASKSFLMHASFRIFIGYRVSHNTSQRLKKKLNLIWNNVSGKERLTGLVKVFNYRI